jgi:hypothetical protein
MGAAWGLFGRLRALQKAVRRQFYTPPDLGTALPDLERGVVLGVLGWAWSRF